MRRLFKNIARLWKDTELELLPLAKDIFKYRWGFLFPDIFSGLNVALLIFPQAMVYALLAGLPVEYGLYGAIVATMGSALFSGSRVLNLGPTNSTAVVMLSSLTACGVGFDRFTEVLPIVLVMTGCFLVISACLNISSLVQFVSRSVILGYMSAVIIIMIVNQLHTALGFDLNVIQDGSITFFDILKATVMGIKDTDLSSFFICLFVILLYFFWKKFIPEGPIIALTIFTLAGFSYVFIRFFNANIQVLDKVYASSWQASLQGFTWDNVNAFAGTAFALSFICLIDGTTILKALSARMGQKANINQMVFGMGFANIFCGLCSGMPASGSLVRSSANYLSGAKTSLTSLFCGLFCLLGIVCLGPFFNYVPKSGLAMIVILLGLGLFENKSIKIILKTNRSDACVFITTFISSFLFPLNISIFLGVLVSVALFLKKAAIPEFCEYSCQDGDFTQIDGEENAQSEISIIHIEGNLFFASAELFRDQIREICQRPQLKVIILKMRNAFYIDATCLLALEELLRYMHANGRQMILSEVGKTAMQTLKRSGMYEIIGSKNIFKDDLTHLNDSTANAMKRAQVLIGQSEIVVRILTRNNPGDYFKRFDKLKSLVKPLKRGFSNVIERARR